MLAKGNLSLNSEIRKQWLEDLDCIKCTFINDGNMMVNVKMASDYFHHFGAYFRKLFFITTSHKRIFLHFYILLDH